jgi:hypothetical protein
MEKKYISFFSLLIILAFIGYIIYDTSSDSTNTEDELQSDGPVIPPASSSAPSRTPTATRSAGAARASCSSAW